MDLASLLNQRLSYWDPGQNDGYGGASFGVAREVQCRWENKTDKYRDKDGVEHVSNAVVYTLEPLSLAGYIALGVAGTVDGNGPTDHGAVEIRHVGASPSLQADQQLYKSWV